MKTFSAKDSEVQRDWFVIDATDKVLGRVASEVARRLRGKHKPEFTPHVDTGDYIIVVNASKLRVTGNKMTDGNTIATAVSLVVSTKRPLKKCSSVFRVGHLKKPSKACFRRVLWAMP